MRSFRQKPVGWRFESFRHYLAAKGVKTRYSARKRFVPQRPVDTSVIPVGSQWTAERKWDGTRMMADVEGNNVLLVNRRQRVKSRQFPELQSLAKGVRGDAVLDGEVVVLKDGDRESFRDLSSREHTQDKGKIEVLARKKPATYIAFDILEVRGRSVKDRPLKERRSILRSVVSESPRLRIVRVRRDIKKYARELRRKGAEGVVFKDENSKYHGGRSNAWRKLKFKKENDVVAVGYTEGTGKRKGLIGALKIAINGRPVGKVGTGFTDVENRALKRLLDKGKQPVIRVEHRGVGSRGRYREPVYVGLRTDIGKEETHV